MSSLDPHTEKRKAAKAKSARILDRLGVKELELNEHEGECILPPTIRMLIRDALQR